MLSSKKTMPTKPDTRCMFHSSCGCLYYIDGEMLASIAHNQLNVLAMFCSNLAEYKENTKHNKPVVSHVMPPDLELKFYSHNDNMYAFNGNVLNTFNYTCLQSIATYCSQLALYQEYEAKEVFEIAQNSQSRE